MSDSTSMADKFQDSGFVDKDYVELMECCKCDKALGYEVIDVGADEFIGRKYCLDCARLEQ